MGISVFDGSTLKFFMVAISVDEAAEYLGIPKGTLYMKLSEMFHTKWRSGMLVISLVSRPVIGLGL